VLFAIVWFDGVLCLVVTQPSPEPVKMKKATKKASTKKTASKKPAKKARAVLGERDANIDDEASVLSGKSATKKKHSQADIEQIYTKKSQLEHILLRPDTYGM